MNDHINKFNTLLQEVEYNTPSEILPMKKESINLYFLQSLGQDWEIWGMAKGENIRKTPTAELMAEVRALAASGSNSNSTSQASETPSTITPTQTSQEAKALAT